MKLPEIDPITEAIDAYHAEQEDGERYHLGASSLGHHCDRWLWLNFRWAVIEKFSGRMKRLFRRGQNEEAIVVSDLRAIGMDIRGTGNNQERVDFGCHVSGSMDGVIESGVLQAPKKRHVLEIKTHNKKSFDSLVKDGVEASKPMHYAQMQTYMHGKEIDRALYVAVCKDDDRMHTERARYDKGTAEALVARGKRIALAERIPEPCSGASPDWYLCKFCAGYDICHGSKTTKEANCRTCAHSTPTKDSTWTCARYDGVDIPKTVQPLGCESHVMHPDLVPWKMLDSDHEHIAKWSIDGVIVLNGEPAERVYRSSEILANPEYCKAPTAEVENLRVKCCAKVGIDAP